MTKKNIENIPMSVEEMSKLNLKEGTPIEITLVSGNPKHKIEGFPRVMGYYKKGTIEGIRISNIFDKEWHESNNYDLNEIQNIKILKYKK